MYYAEKQAKEFLEKEGFDVLPSIYIKSKNKIKSLKGIIEFPVAVKIFGKNIVHKSRIGGVQLNVMSIEECLKAFKKMKKIKGFEGIVIQEQIKKGKEILLGIKKTPEFGHIVVFGAGGINVEKTKDVSFRVFPLNKKEIIQMINETKISKHLNENEKKVIIDNILLLQKLSKKYPDIVELDINPLVVEGKKGKIIDARIVFEKSLPANR